MGLGQKAINAILCNHVQPDADRCIMAANDGQWMQAREASRRRATLLVVQALERDMKSARSKQFHFVLLHCEKFAAQQCVGSSKTCRTSSLESVLLDKPDEHSPHATRLPLRRALNPRARPSHAWFPMWFPSSGWTSISSDKVFWISLLFLRSGKAMDCPDEV